MSMRRTLCAPALLSLLAACGGGGGGSGTGPTDPGSTSSVSVVVFYDENANGRLDSTEVVRLPNVEVTGGGAVARTAANGRATLAAVSGSTASLSVTAGSLPAYYRAAAVSTNLPASGEVALPVTLLIGSNRPNTYMGYGDSITQGGNFAGDPAYFPSLQSKLTAYLGAAQMFNEGVGSLKSRQTEFLPGPLANDRPAYVLILLGTNDWTQTECGTVARLTTTCFTISSLRSIIQTVRAANSLPVLATIPPVNEGFALSPPQRNDWVEALNPMIKQLAREEGVPLADVERGFVAQGISRDLFVDHIHPSAAGQEIIATAFFEAVTRASSLNTLEYEPAPLLMAAPSAPARARIVERPIGY